MSRPDSDQGTRPAEGRETRARRLGRAVQALALAILILAVALRLLQIEQSLAFRYGGF